MFPRAATKCCLTSRRARLHHIDIALACSTPLASMALETAAVAFKQPCGKFSLAYLSIAQQRCEKKVFYLFANLIHPGVDLRFVHFSLGFRESHVGSWRHLRPIRSGSDPRLLYTGICPTPPFLYPNLSRIPVRVSGNDGTRF